MHIETPQESTPTEKFWPRLRLPRIGFKGFQGVAVPEIRISSRELKTAQNNPSNNAAEKGRISCLIAQAFYSHYSSFEASVAVIGV
jgi:hypothetical protein